MNYNKITKADLIEFGVIVAILTGSIAVTLYYSAKLAREILDFVEFIKI